MKDSNLTGEDLDRIQSLVCYRTLPVWDVKTLPQPFRECHNTKSGVWARLRLLSGSLVMEYLDEEKRVTGRSIYSVTNQPEWISPRQNHRIASCSDDMTCQLSFYSEKNAV